MSTKITNQLFYLTENGQKEAKNLKPYDVDDFIQLIYSQLETFKKYLEEYQLGKSVNLEAIKQYKTDGKDEYFVGLKGSFVMVKIKEPLLLVETPPQNAKALDGDIAATGTSAVDTSAVDTVFAGLGGVASAIGVIVSIISLILTMKESSKVKQIVDYELTTLIVNSTQDKSLRLHSTHGGLSLQECSYEILPSFTPREIPKKTPEETPKLFPAGFVILRSAITVEGNTVKSWFDCTPRIRYEIFKKANDSFSTTNNSMLIVTNPNVYFTKPEYFNVSSAAYNLTKSNLDTNELNFGIFAKKGDLDYSNGRTLFDKNSSAYSRNCSIDNVNFKMIASPDAHSLTPTSILFVE